MLLIHATVVADVTIIRPPIFLFHHAVALAVELGTYYVKIGESFSRQLSGLEILNSI